MTWRALRSDSLAGTWWGWKNPVDEDRPTFTPEQTVAASTRRRGSSPTSRWSDRRRQEESLASDARARLRP